MIKLAIGMPNTGQIKTQTVFALIRMLKPIPFEYKMIFKEGSILHLNREEIVKVAIKEECTHLLFVDSDMSFEEDALRVLFSRKKDIIGVHYNTRQLPPKTTVHMDAVKKSRLKEDYPDGFLTCDAVATGFMLINLEVFKKISQPWFFWESDDKGEVTMGEDYWFCKKAREAGYEVWVDLTIPMKHIGDYLY